MVCIGKYEDVPKIPEFPRSKGPEIFQGKVLHTIDYCKLQKEETSQLLKGKKVAVIGFKKSAIDLALECAEENQGMKISLSLSLFLYIYIYKGFIHLIRGNFNSKCFRYQISLLLLLLLLFCMLINISLIYFAHKILLDPYPKERNKFIDV